MGFARYLKNPWTPFDNIADRLSQVVTLLTVAVAGVFVYLPTHARPADPVTQQFLAPAILILVFGALVFSFKESLPPHVTNEFAILGLAASMLRALPFSSGK